MATASHNPRNILTQHTCLRFGYWGAWYCIKKTCLNILISMVLKGFSNSGLICQKSWNAVNSRVKNHLHFFFPCVLLCTTGHRQNWSFLPLAANIAPSYFPCRGLPSSMPLYYKASGPSLTSRVNVISICCSAMNRWSLYKRPECGGSTLLIRWTCILLNNLNTRWRHTISRCHDPLLGCFFRAFK